MSARIKGTGLVLEIDGVDYYADCVSAVLENEEAAAAVTTFADAAAGGARQFYFAIEAIQSRTPLRSGRRFGTTRATLLTTRSHQLATTPLPRITQSSREQSRFR